MKEKLSIIKDSIILNKIGGVSNLIKTAGAIFSEPLYTASFPIYIQIEPAIICNLKCKMCISPFLERKTQCLSLEKFKIIEKQFPYLRKISLVGVGEPLLNPDLFKIIQWAKSKKMLIGFTTNGVLLTKMNIENILNVEPDWLNISVDGATKETYERIRQGADFDLVINNIKELMKAKKNNKIKISLWFLGMRDNIEELPQVVKLTSELGIKKLNMQTVHYWGKKEWKLRLNGQQLNDSLVKLKSIILQAINTAKKYNIRFNYVNTPFNKSKRACQWPWKSCYITVDGFVTPCCIHGSDPHVINFGNIFEKPFHEIWNNIEYQAFRKSLKSDVPPEICIGCTSYYEKFSLDKI